MRCKKVQLSYGTRKAIKSVLVAVTAFALVLQPCFLSPAYALTGDYDKNSNYPDWDDTDYRYNDYWSGDVARKVTNVTRNYGDGTQYTAAYQYNDQGNMIDANIKEADGSKITIKRVFEGENIISDILYEYDASDKSELTHLTEYGYGGNPTHHLYTWKYSDQTTASKELWDLGDDEYYPIKRIEIDRDGTITHTENTYGIYGQLLTSKTTCSDGSESLTENHYDEDGEKKYGKRYAYDAVLKIKSTSEYWMDGDWKTGTIHQIETETSEEGGERKEEAWSRAKDGNLIRKIITNADGTQFTEEHFYNNDGYETLYTRTGSEGTSERCETVITEERTTKTYWDGKGYRSVISEYEEVINSLWITESTTTYADGSSSYAKQSYNYDKDYANYGAYRDEITRKVTADGRETYIEVTREMDGETTKTKTPDGIVTVKKTDVYGNPVSRSKTLPDGITAETSWEMREDGEISTEVTRYSDGSEDRIIYEYDGERRAVRITESRRNGVTAVTQVQYGADSGCVAGSITFNNGYAMTWSQEKIDEDTQKLGISFSHGAVSQDIKTMDGSFTDIQLKTIYRDGSSEELNADNSYSYNSWYENSRKIGMTSVKHYEDFEIEAWGIHPIQTETVPQTVTYCDEVPAAVQENQ